MNRTPPHRAPDRFFGDPYSAHGPPVHPRVLSTAPEMPATGAGPTLGNGEHVGGTGEHAQRAPSQSLEAGATGDSVRRVIGLHLDYAQSSPLSATRSGAIPRSWCSSEVTTR